MTIWSYSVSWSFGRISEILHSAFKRSLLSWHVMRLFLWSDKLWGFRQGWEHFQGNKLWLSLLINYAKQGVKLPLHLISNFLSFYRLKFLVFSLFRRKSSCPMLMFWLCSYFLPFCCKGRFCKHHTMLLLKQESTWEAQYRYPIYY